VLAAMMLDRKAIKTVLDKNISEKSFQDEGHRAIFRGIIALNEKSIETSPANLARQLKKSGDLKEIGGLPFIYHTAGATPTSFNVSAHTDLMLSDAH